MKFGVKYLFLFIVLLSASCLHYGDKREADIGKIKINDVKIARYEQALFNIDKSLMKAELKKLQPQFPMFLDGDLNDSANLNRIYDYISDTMLASVYNDCKYKFPDLTDIEAKLTKTFRYVKCYYPEKKLPDVFTYVSGFDYEYPVQYFDNHLLIAIDMYLGADYLRYKKLGLANYILRRFSKEYIVRDCMFAMVKAETDRRQIGSAFARHDDC